MVITTKFSIGDHAYLLDQAKEGVMTPVRIITIRAISGYPACRADYEIYGSGVFNHTWYPESQLLTFLEAKAVATAAIRRQKDKTTGRLGELLGTFAPVSSQLVVV